MGISREESHELMMAQIERCVKHQDEKIPLPLGPTAPWEWIDPGEHIPMEDFGNGAGLVPCENESVNPYPPGYFGEYMG